jgi:hypothetical protein
MTSAVAGILQSIEGLSLPEQEELMLALCDRAMMDAPLEWAMGADPRFAELDLLDKRALLRQKLLAGLEQVQQGKSVDGEVVFERLQAKLHQLDSRFARICD